MDAVKRGSRDLKRKVLEPLRSDNFDQRLNELCELPARQVINPLFSFLCSSDEQTKWRAITAMGTVVANLAEKDMESARVIIGRLMWSLNDESGGIGWGAPEAMGEIIASHEGLAKEYATILISYVREDGNFLEYEPLQRGAVWGLGRVAQARPDLVQDAVPHLLAYLESTDATVRGLAAWTVGLLGAKAAQSQLEALLGDDTEIPLYLDRRLVFCRVSNLAKEALAGANKNPYPFLKGS
ncbi:MAG: HEAT repeat domain-containing protein [Deltaproteobacteria bacterium]|nr:MAG: HEAT repeat domain-containing protein [Deltaproteobacteria bacterium]